jgi:hypothetical protein
LSQLPQLLFEKSTSIFEMTKNRVNGRRALSSTQLPAGQVIFGK